VATVSTSTTAWSRQCRHQVRMRRLMPRILEKKTACPNPGSVQCLALTTFRKSGQAMTTLAMLAEPFGTIYLRNMIWNTCGRGQAQMPSLYHTCQVRPYSSHIVTVARP
jgi:hypothetical protein